jgi:glycosyltransferase involved in cell wall biosynthesis
MSDPPFTGDAAAASGPILSSIVLNWNRADLLKRTLESLVRTVTVPHELLVIDNGSTDDSRDLITKFCGARPGAQAILLDANRGGEAINVALQRARGRLIHITENDIEYLPGWCETVIGLFDSFQKLGQLSPFGPVPEDEEVWVNKPCVLRHSEGQFCTNRLPTLVRRAFCGGSLSIMASACTTFRARELVSFPMTFVCHRT